LNFDLWPPETSFLIIFLDFLKFHFTELSFELTPETSFSSFFCHKRNKRIGRDGRVG
jgi:hypothetical protein